MLTRIRSFGDHVLGLLVPRMEAQALCSGAVMTNKRCVNEECWLWRDHYVYYFVCPNGESQHIYDACGTCAI